jgi:tRNA (cytidine/uridine-2'-O-)-methyltransferase
VLRIAFHHPVIPGNTGNAIRLAAATGFELHLIGPLGFQLTDAHLRRAGLDYHDLATVVVHDDIGAAWLALMPARVFAFTARAERLYTDVAYRRGDVLLFGTETTGLPADVLTDPHITDPLRIPMLPARRSLNLANSAALATYEAWRQLDFAGA